MNNKIVISLIASISILSAYAVPSIGVDSNKSKRVDTNVTIKDKKLFEEMSALERKEKKITLENSLSTEKLKSQNSELLRKLQEIKWQKEILKEKLELQKIEDEKRSYERKKKYQDELDEMQFKSTLSEAKSTQMTNEIKLKQLSLAFNQEQLTSEIKLLKIKKERDIYITPKSVYLDNPLSEDNETLIISDRRIELNGVIGYSMANKISEQINYYNNKNSKKPIFLVIDTSPGGSIMAGNIIIRSMKSSKAPVYVVLKSFAASMAAVIVTLADKSYAYPQAVMLHHQPMSFSFGFHNLTEEREHYENLKKWWHSFAIPIAKKMGITTEEFMEQMYKHSSRGDWREFATDAQKLKWVNNIIMKIEEKSILVHPLYQEEREDHEKSSSNDNRVAGDSAFVNSLPHLHPSDAYFIYNPDGFYRLK